MRLLCSQNLFLAINTWAYSDAFGVFAAVNKQ